MPGLKPRPPKEKIPEASRTCGSCGTAEAVPSHSLGGGFEAAGGALSDEAVDLGFDEDAEEFGVYFVIADAEFEDIEGAVGGHGAFVRAVGGGESVVDVADGHHFGLHGNFVGGEAAGVAGAVEFFVMGPGDFRNAAKIAGPGNLREEVEAVDYVGLDLT